MGAASIVEALAAVVACGAVTFAAGGFVENAKATTKTLSRLTDAFEGHINWSQEIVRDHDERFHEHDNRITKLEIKDATDGK